MTVSTSVKLVWYLAGREAIAADFESIEPEHFLIALLKFVEMPVEKVRVMGEERVLVKEFDAEIQALLAELDMRKINPKAIRRALRRAMGKGTAARRGEVMHRTPATREVFRQAERAAADDNGSTLMGHHLLKVLLESPTPALVQSLGMTDTVGSDKRPGQPMPLLEKHGRDLNSRACLRKENRLPEGRAVIGVLGQNARNSVLLASDDGDVAMNVVVAACCLMSSGLVSPSLRGKRMIDLSGVPTGRVKPEEREELIEKILAEAGSAQDVILYLPVLTVEAQGVVPWVDTLQILAEAGKVQFIARIPADSHDRISEDSEWRRLASVVCIETTNTHTIPQEL